MSDDVFLRQGVESNALWTECAEKPMGFTLRSGAALASPEAQSRPVRHAFLSVLSYVPVYSKKNLCLCRRTQVSGHSHLGCFSNFRASSVFDFGVS